LRPIDFPSPQPVADPPDETATLDNVIPFGVFDAFTDGSR